MSEKRMAGDYEVFASMSVGCKEIVMGENPKAEEGAKYMCAYCESNSLFEQYNEVMVSDDYVEILQLCCKRLTEEADKLKEEIDLEQKVSSGIVPSDGYTPITPDSDLRGQVVVIKPDVFKREYQRSTHQYHYVTGGSGSSPLGRGTSVFTYALYDGEKGRFGRHQVLGIADPESLPEWAKTGLATAIAEKKKDKEAR